MSRGTCPPTNKRPRDARPWDKEVAPRGELRARAHRRRDTDRVGLRRDGRVHQAPGLGEQLSGQLRMQGVAGAMPRITPASVKRLGEPKVEHLRDAVLADADVDRLQIAMDDIRGVRGVERLGASSKPTICAMRRWFSAASARASRWNRATRSGSLANAVGSTFNATSCPSLASRLDMAMAGARSAPCASTRARAPRPARRTRRR